MKKLKDFVAVFALLFVSFIFTYKYSSRYSEFGLYIAIAITVFQFLVFQFRNKVSLNNKVKNIFCYGFLGLMLALVFISHFAIPLSSLSVDRWSVISSFLIELSNGNYPYYATSHMGNYPGPMPVYFLIAAPFYYLGELSILSVLGYAIIALILIRKRGQSGASMFIILYLLSALYVFWEIVSRSNVFTFSVLTLLVLNLFLNTDKNDKLKFYGTAILIGLMLSTRSVYVLPYLIFFLSALTLRELSFKKWFYFLAVAVLAFVSTFLPLIYFFYEDFVQMNPFIIQSSFLVPPEYTIGFMLLAILFSFLVKNHADKFFYSGLNLFLAILIYSSYYLANYGFETSFIGSKIDISYFIFSIPFFIKYLIDSPDNRNEHSYHYQ